ncbi:uncharacterized protein LOC113233333 isoform X1 [Hyposmocoma kahamanoa]|uniref:uncharacterized protein LOC113233333 isoform X1 n=1 Tax=Hyposmocoma kahamanoa TaxID=1477025 RepID=UPI000E6D7E8A|nr:uncharacterized protein LOC113233333 isoform X1 [Hyposmocoma kahamanoa]
MCNNRENLRTRYLPNYSLGSHKRASSLIQSHDNCVPPSVTPTEQALRGMSQARLKSLKKESGGGNTARIPLHNQQPGTSYAVHRSAQCNFSRQRAARGGAGYVLSQDSGGQRYRQRYYHKEIARCCYVSRAS